MRICLYGGAGAGKSTQAAAIFAELRKRGYSCELVQEFIKNWAYQKRICKSFDQCFIFGSQLHAEDFFLQHGVEHIVTDSPLMLQVCYCQKYGRSFWKELYSITEQFEAVHPGLHILLDRANIPYVEAGRYEDYKEALAMDRYMENFLLGGVKIHKVDASDTEAIMKLVVGALNDRQVN